jgi:predicted transcriptional regulator
MWGSTDGTSGMHGYGMMGDGGYTSSFLWLIPAGLIGIAVIGVIGVVFYLAFPEIMTVTGANERARNESVSADSRAGSAPPVQPQSLGGLQSPYESVSKTLTPEERKVLNVLVAHQGKYLQKYIRKEAGLSRLKTHRIITRFAERRIVSLKKTGNTNEISLSDWLKDSTAQNSD